MGQSAPGAFRSAQENLRSYLRVSPEAEVYSRAVPSEDRAHLQTPEEHREFWAEIPDDEWPDDLVRKGWRILGQSLTALGMRLAQESLDSQVPPETP